MMSVSQDADHDRNGSRPYYTALSRVDWSVKLALAPPHRRTLQSPTLLETEMSYLLAAGCRQSCPAFALREIAREVT